MIIKFILSLLIFAVICLPMMLVSIPVVAVLLLTNWDGKTTWFGNAKWGKGDQNPAYLGKTGYWNAFNWLVIRNPINNFSSFELSTESKPYTATGNENIGDKIAGGLYSIKMGKFWEVYWIKPYTLFGTKRCIRLRFGWKISKTVPGSLCQFVFAPNPFKPYLGV